MIDDAAACSSTAHADDDTADRSDRLSMLFSGAMLVARTAQQLGRMDLAQTALERAHLLGQHRFGRHLRVHWRMLGLAHLRGDGREVAGQWLRLALVPIGHLTRRLPSGNVGTTRMGPMETAPLPLDLSSLVPQRDLHMPLPVWFALAFLVAIADQATKAMVADKLPLGAQLTITPFFNLVHAYNRGAAFGVLADAGGVIAALLVLIGVLASVWLAREVVVSGGRRHETAGFALILGGAIGNTWDRVRRGAVTDFLDFHWYQSHWPAFNLADVAINVGVLILLVEWVRRLRASRL